jgi:MraZ protein
VALFLSTYINKIDKKGRVSIPSSFRNTLLNEEFSGIVIYNSFNNKCIESCSFTRIEKIHDLIDNLDPFSDERDALATTILGNCLQLTFDPEGRVTIPQDFLNYANLDSQACFVGKGATFEIWNPEDFENYKQKAQIIAKEQRSLIKFTKGV